jgi:hypothetical protein
MMHMYKLDNILAELSLRFSSPEAIRQFMGIHLLCGQIWLPPVAHFNLAGVCCLWGLTMCVTVIRLIRPWTMHKIETTLCHPLSLCYYTHDIRQLQLKICVGRACLNGRLLLCDNNSHVMSYFLCTLPCTITLGGQGRLHRLCKKQVKWRTKPVVIGKFLWCCYVV